jgi:LEA14-like dessication related protein
MNADMGVLLKKKILEELEKSLISNDNVTATKCNPSSTELTMNDIYQAVDEISKHQINARASLYVDIDSVLVIDHEEIRRAIIYHTERGKTIVYNPNNKLIKEELIKLGLIEREE